MSEYFRVVWVHEPYIATARGRAWRPNFFLVELRWRPSRAPFMTNPAQYPYSLTYINPTGYTVSPSPTYRNDRLSADGAGLGLSGALDCRAVRLPGGSGGLVLALVGCS